MLDVDPDAAGPLRLDVIERLRTNGILIEPLILKAISTLRRGVGDQSTRYCQEMDAADIRKYRVAHAREALAKLNLVLLYDTHDATAWYLRTVCYYALDEMQLCERDLRRMVELETAEGEGPNRRLERLRMTEHLQGDFRRQLERLRKRIAREVPAGKPPLTLSDIP